MGGETQGSIEHSTGSGFNTRAARVMYVTVAITVDQSSAKSRLDEFAIVADIESSLAGDPRVHAVVTEEVRWTK